MFNIIDKSINEKINVYENACEFLTNENEIYHNLIVETQKNENCFYNDNIKIYYDIMKLNCEFFVRMIETYKNNEIKYVFRFDDCFIVYLNNNVVHSYI